MKLLFDENLSKKLVSGLADIFPESTHVAHAGLLTSSDLEIWNFARAQSFVIVTADADFYELATTFGHPPKVIWLRACNYPTRDAAKILCDRAIRLMEFGEDADRAIFILNP